MVIFPLAPDQTIAQMWSNGARGGSKLFHSSSVYESNSNSRSTNRGRGEVPLVEIFRTTTASIFQPVQVQASNTVINFVLFLDPPPFLQGALLPHQRSAHSNRSICEISGAKAVSSQICQQIARRRRGHYSH